MEKTAVESKKCGNADCNCSTRAGDDFCSEQCAAAGGDENACRCGHSDCK